MTEVFADRVIFISLALTNSINSKETAKRFFSDFEKVYPELRFSLMGQWEPFTTKYNPDQAIDEWVKDRGEIGRVSFGDCFYSGKKPANFLVHVNWNGPGSHKRWGHSVSVSLDEEFWLRNLLDDASGRAIRMLKSLASLGSPLQGRIGHTSEFEEKNFVNKKRPDGLFDRESINMTAKEGIVDLYWANLFGKPYVNLFGLQSLMDLEGPLKERISEGVLLVFGSGPFDWKIAQIKTLQERAKKILNNGAFFDKTTLFKPNLNI